MPGLVVVAGDPHAEARARRAAAPLLRRPWERLSLGVRAGGTVAIGAAGERAGLALDRASGCTLAFEGELYAPPAVRTGAVAARELLAGYLRAGVTFAPPEGSYCAAVWDGRSDTLVLLTDRFDTRTLYVAADGDAVLAAGELKGLVAAGLTPSLDLQGAAEVLAYAEFVADRTLLAGARRLPGATTLVLGPDGPSELVRWRYRVRPTLGALDEREAVEEFGRLFARAVGTKVDGAESFALSGGLDSRCVAAVLAERGFRGLAVTHAFPESREVELARRAASRAGLRHRVHRLSRGSMAAGARSCVWLSEGLKVPFSSQALSFRSLRTEDGARALVTGSRGDSAVRMEALRPAAGASQLDAIHAHLARGLGPRLADVLRPAFADELRGLARSALAERLAADAGDDQALLAQLNFRENGIASPALFHDHLAARAAYEDVALAEFCAGLPYELRIDGRLQRAFLRRHRALAGVATWNEGYPSTVPDRLERAVRSAVRARRRATTRAAAHLPPGRRRFPYLYFEDVLLAGGGALGLLLEERTLARGQLRPEGVRPLVEETLGGRAPHVSLLGRLVRLELFQRLFVDGDGAPPELGAPERPVREPSEAR